MSLLEGIGVLEVAELLPGPYCGFLLASMGARVTKVERPGAGDGARTLAPALFAALNAKKDSLTLDLKSSGGRRELAALLGESNALLVSFRPQTLGALGLDAPSVRRANARIVYASLTGYGTSGPYAELPGHDVNYQAVAGTLGDAEWPALPLADLTGAMSAALAICAALVRQERTGRGATLDLALADAAASLASLRVAVPPRGRRGGYGAFACADGRRLALGCIEQKFFDSLFAVLSRYGLHVDEYWRTRQGRAGDAKGLDRSLARVLATKGREEWLGIFQAADVPAMAVRGPHEQAADPHLSGRGFGKGLAPPFRFEEDADGTP